MYKVLEATYRNGSLILRDKLGTEMEGKRLKVVILNIDDDQKKKETFFEFVDRQSFQASAERRIASQTLRNHPWLTFHANRNNMYQSGLAVSPYTNLQRVVIYAAGEMAAS